MELNREQLKGIELCANISIPIVSITGAAGTGKTTILKESYARIKEQGYDVKLVAPTGKACKRITEVTEIYAQTIHRLLAYGYPRKDEDTGANLYQPRPRFTKDNKLGEEPICVFIDEASMLTWELYDNLWEALPDKSIIRMFGDVNQLPPIEQESRGSVFSKSLLNDPKVVLTQVYRQNAESNILLNAQRILRKQSILHKEGSDLEYYSFTHRNAFMLVLREVISKADYTSLNNQIITPVNGGPLGTEQLNVWLQNIFMRNQSHSIFIDRHNWSRTDTLKVFLGDKVILTQNVCSPEYEVYNGEVGIVTEFLEQGIKIDLGDRIVLCPYKLKLNLGEKSIILKPTRDIQLAYALTTHKSQGSEYDNVVYLQLTKNAWSNLYTGVTRAKKMCYILQI